MFGHLDVLDAQALRGYVQRTADLGYDALWVPETVGREPFTLLASVAERAGRMWLGTCIASIWARDPMASRMAAMTLHELTSGRFVLGLGVSHAHLAQKLRGHTYERPLARMRGYLESYRGLPYKGPLITAPDGEPTEPPLVLAALRDRMLGLAATETAGAFPYLVTAERVTLIRAVLDRAAPAHRRPWLGVTLPVVLDEDARSARTTGRAYLAPYIRTPNYQASWALQGFGPDDWAQPGSEALVDAMVAWGTTDQAFARIAVAPRRRRRPCRSHPAGSRWELGASADAGGVGT